MSNQKRDSKGSLCFWQCARSFLHDELPLIRRASDKTIEAYRFSLECYLIFLDAQHGVAREEVSFDFFSSDYIRSFIKWMGDVKGYSSKTINLRLSAIRSLLKYSSYEDISLVALSKSADGVRGPKQTKQPIQYLSQQATTALLSAAGSKTTKQRRNRMMLIFMYDTGVRVSEIVQIMRGDIHLGEHAFVTIKGKGMKIRSVPLMRKTVEHLEYYLSEFHPAPKSENPLFYSHKQGIPEPLSTDTVSLVLKNCAEKARESCKDIPEKMHCHLLRKTRAMDLYQEGVPLPIIMQFLGHESVTTTSSFYAFATLNMVREAIEKSNPPVHSELPCWKSDHAKNVLYSLK